MSGSLKRILLILTITARITLASSATSAAEARETPLVRAVQLCRKSVVNINTERLAAEEKEARFFSQKSRKVSGMGTGIIVDERGYIVTNYHVIQDVDKILVTMDDGATYDGRPVSFDRKQDLAIIRIDAGTSLTVMPMGTSTDLMLAETVFAVGNAYGYEHTVTSGIISALHRDVEVDETQSYENLIQTDAAINPGNSGGPLLNLDGEVIGINVAIRAGAQRIGFAIPIDEARRSIARLMSVERLNGIGHGLTTVDIKASRDHQLVIEKVATGSASEKSGLKAGDVIRSVRGLIVRDGTDLERSLLDLPSGKVIDIVLLRDGAEQTVQYTVGTASAAASVAVGGTGDIDGAAAARTVSLQTAAVPETSQEPAAAAVKVDDLVLQRVWELLGIRLGSLNERELGHIKGRYHGGMKVIAVQANGPAARHGIRTGDILLGLDGFETLSVENIRFIMSEARIQKMSSLPFLIMRSGNALQGRMELLPSR